MKKTGGAFMRRFTVLFAVLALVGVPVFGATYGTIKVTVTDGSGAALPGATVEATSPVFIGTRSEVTDSAGMANLTGLTPGRYSIKVSLDGFQTQTLTSHVSADKATDVTAKLALAGVAESITVTAEAPIVETKRATIADEVSLEEVEALPVSRDYRGYAQLVAGVNVVPNGGGRDVAVDPASKGGNNYRDRTAEGRTGGTGSRDNQYYLDGVIITDITTGVGSMTFNNEVILEQQIITSGVPAEFAGGKGFVGNIVTKSGGNEFSGSINYYMISPEFYSDFKSSDTKLAVNLEDKSDAALTFGGPIWKDRAWFFLSGQMRENKDEVQLSASASPNGGTTNFSNERHNYFGKVTFKPTEKTTVIAQYFEDPSEVSNASAAQEPDVNLVPGRYIATDSTPKTVWGSLQHIFGSTFLVDARVGQMKWDFFQVAQNPELGVQNTLLFAAGDPAPNYVKLLGGASTDFTNIQKRDQIEASGTYFLNAMGSHTIKGGVQIHELQDLTNSKFFGGITLTSIAPQYSGVTWADVYARNISRTDYDYIYGKLALATTSNSFKAADTNHDGVLTREEFGAITFSSTAGNNGGINFFRNLITREGANNVKQNYNTVFLQDDWNINNFAVNVGVRVEDLEYINSRGETIVDLDPTVAPRLGLTYDIGGQGRQKISAFYGRYYDPIRMDMVHFGGNVSGRVLDEQAFIGNEWFTFRTRGSATIVDAGFAPNIKNQYQDEYSLTYGININPTLGFTAQLYQRKDRNLIEDYDPAVYVGNAHADSLGLGLTYADFGYGPEGPGLVNFFLANLVGAKRDTTGLDLSVEKRFADNWTGSVQYSYKKGEGNTSSDGNADLQGDLLEVDPRLPYMNGNLPGVIPHTLKLFGSYRTPWNIEVGALWFWSAGAYYTEGDRAFGIIIPHDLTPNNTTDLAFTKIGDKQHPSYHTLDLKFRYQLGLMKGTGLDLFLDVYNVLNNQDALYVEVVHNDGTFTQFGQTRTVLDPRRYQIGARFTF
jgi:hypothetical protein